ncbi:MAG: hypothetical protein WDN04_13845 [Rhodospirillales bacterium]
MTDIPEEARRAIAAHPFLQAAAAEFFLNSGVFATHNDFRLHMLAAIEARQPVLAAPGSGQEAKCTSL